MIELLMDAVGDWGAPALFALLAVNCFGVPFPMSLLLLAVGAIVADGDLDAVTVLLSGIAGAIVGDQAGYWLGRVGGRPAMAAAARRFALAGAMERAEAFSRRHGAPGVFLTRWLLSPLGPYVNIVAGTTHMPWPAFTAWGALGEAVWVGIYVGLGAAFSDAVPALADLLGNATWFLVALAATLGLGFAVYRMRRPAH